MSPSFSPAAAKAYAGLADFGIELTEVRVRLNAANGISLDTTISFPLSQDTLVIDIPVGNGGTDQPFTVLVEIITPVG